MDVQGVGALVTGGASGLGAATVERLRTAGAEVVVADLQGPTPVDVADADTMEALVATVPNLRVLVCCAGLGSQGGRVVRRSGPLGSRRLVRRSGPLGRRRAAGRTPQVIFERARQSPETVQTGSTPECQNAVARGDRMAAR